MEMFFLLISFYEINLNDDPMVNYVILKFICFRENKIKFMSINKKISLHKNAACNLEQVLAATPHKTPTVRPPASYHENYSS